MSDETAALGVLVVDDNALVADALERRFNRTPDFKWLGWASDGASAEQMVLDRKPDIVLLDVDMPGVDSFALLRGLAERAPDSAVVMFSGHARPEYVERALGEGAAGYILKDEPIPVIVDLLRRAGRGESVLSPFVARVYLRSHE